MRAMCQVTIAGEKRAVEIALYVKQNRPPECWIKLFQDIAVKDEHTLFVYGTYEHFWILEGLMENLRGKPGIIFAGMI